MWQRLTIQHAQSAAENKHLLMRKFFEYKYQPEHDVMTHISTIEQLASQLNDLKEPISESQLITKILITLPSSFRYFLSVWDNVPSDQKTIQVLTQRILKEENFSKLYLDTKSSSTDDQAFSSQPHRPFRGQRERSRGGFGARRGGHPYQTNRKCHFCGGTNHFIATCRDRIKAEKEAAKNKEVSNIATDIQQPETNNNQDPADLSYQSLFPSTTQVHDEDKLWFADSGATRHMTHQKSVLKNFIPVEPESWFVTGIGNTRLPVRGKGDIEAKSTINGITAVIHIPNVLYIPKLGTNLFSIGAATSQGVKAIFTNDEVHFYKDGKLQLVGKRTKNTLYCLNISIDMEETDVAMAAKHTCPLSTWHERFAHTSNNTILKMSTLGLTDGLNLKNSSLAHNLCVGCKLGKMTRLPFPIGRLRATTIGSLIHSDVCGPMEHPSPSGARYFVTFKDDHSGWCSVHFMKNKDEVPMFFLNFAASVKTQTGNNVIVLRSDNGGEYTGKEFRNKLLQLGIRHETSAPYTPAQNGVAERIKPDDPECSSQRNLFKSGPYSALG